MTEKLKSGDSIRLRAKKGKYIGLVKHTIRYNGEQLAVVQVNKNKTMSRVPLHRLRKE